MERHVILFDADCGFCRWSLDKILAWDRHDALRAVALQEPEADVLLKMLDPAKRMESWHLVAPDGRVWSAGAAVAPLAKLLPLGAPVSVLARSLPKTTDRVYRWVARNRDRIGSRLGAACEVDPRGRRP